MAALCAHGIMKRNSLTFKEALKKQLWICFVGLIVLSIIAYKLYPVNTGYKQLVFSGFALSLGVLIFFLVQKSSHQILCENCNANLYELIEVKNNSNLKINFCPVCGAKTST